MICSSDNIIAEYLSVATGCDHYRTLGLIFLFAVNKPQIKKFPSFLRLTTVFI